MTSVIWRGGQYIGWYEGSNWEDPSGFGRVTSWDGTRWTKDPRNPVLSPSSNEEEWDYFCIQNPSVLWKDGLYRMWYSTCDVAIGYATSKDGVHWTTCKGNPVLEGTDGQWDEEGIGRPHVMWDGGQYKMWYHSGMGYGIGYATSPDGIHWTKNGANPILKPDPGAWDDQVFDPCVLRTGSTYRMWYTGLVNEPEWLARIGYATSPDGLVWTRYAGNPVLTPGPQPWDTRAVVDPEVTTDGPSKAYRMWYGGIGENWFTKMGFATFTDGITWKKYTRNPVLVGGGR